MGRATSWLFRREKIIFPEIGRESLGKRVGREATSDDSIVHLSLPLPPPLFLRSWQTLSKSTEARFRLVSAVFQRGGKSVNSDIGLHRQLVAVISD